MLRGVKLISCQTVVKVVFVKQGGGAHLTKPGWSKPYTHSNPTNLALFGHKITLYRFNQGAHTIAAGGSNRSRGLSPPGPPHFNHWCQISKLRAGTILSGAKDTPAPFPSRLGVTAELRALPRVCSHWDTLSNDWEPCNCRMFRVNRYCDNTSCAIHQTTEMLWFCANNNCTQNWN